MIYVLTIDACFIFLLLPVQIQPIVARIKITIIKPFWLYAWSKLDIIGLCGLRALYGAIWGIKIIYLMS